MERAPSGFCLSFEPRRGRRRRTSGRGQATSTGLELRLRSMFEPPINVFTHCVRPRVADPSGLPLACGRPDGTGRHLGFPLGFAPRRPGAGRRTPGQGQAIEHGPGTTRSTHRLSISNPIVHSFRATSRRTVQLGREPSAPSGACSITRAAAPGCLLAGTSQAIGKHLCGRILGTSVTPAFVALRSRRLGRSGERSPSKPIVPSRPSSLPRSSPPAVAAVC